MDVSKMKEVFRFYIGCDVVYPDTNEDVVKATLTGVSRTDGVETTYKRKKDNCSGDYLSWTPNGNHISDALHLRLLLYPITEASITDSVLAELWVVIGGAPHLFEYGKDELKKGLIDGDWDESGMQLDFYTITQLINKLRSMKFDCDLLIDEGIAMHPDEAKKITSKKEKAAFVDRMLRIVKTLNEGNIGK